MYVHCRHAWATSKTPPASLSCLDLPQYIRVFGYKNDFSLYPNTKRLHPSSRHEGGRGVFIPASAVPHCGVRRGDRDRERERERERERVKIKLIFKSYLLRLKHDKFTNTFVFTWPSKERKNNNNIQRGQREDRLNMIS